MVANRNLRFLEIVGFFSEVWTSQRKTLDEHSALDDPAKVRACLHAVYCSLRPEAKELVVFLLDEAISDESKPEYADLLANWVRYVRNWAGSGVNGPKPAQNVENKKSGFPGMEVKLSPAALEASRKAAVEMDEVEADILKRTEEMQRQVEQAIRRREEREEREIEVKAISDREAAVRAYEDNDLERRRQRLADLILRPVIDKMIAEGTLPRAEYTVTSRPVEEFKVTEEMREKSLKELEGLLVETGVPKGIFTGEIDPNLASSIESALHEKKMESLRNWKLDLDTSKMEPMRAGETRTVSSFVVKVPTGSVGSVSKVETIREPGMSDSAEVWDGKKVVPATVETMRNVLDEPPATPPPLPTGLTTDRSDPGLRKIRPGGQQEKYLVLSAEERAKGFVRPVRTEYRHKKCYTVTTMGTALSETYARDPQFYSGTYCCHCGQHLALKLADGEWAFVWTVDGEGVGS